MGYFESGSNKLWDGLQFYDANMLPIDPHEIILITENTPRLQEKYSRTVLEDPGGSFVDPHITLPLITRKQ